MRQTAKQLADDLRERVKTLGYERYKLIIQVTVGQKTGQAMRIQSRCLWVSSLPAGSIQVAIVLCQGKHSNHRGWLADVCCFLALQDANADNSASCFYENETLYCVCQVYGLYYE